MVRRSNSSWCATIRDALAVYFSRDEPHLALIEQPEVGCCPIPRRTKSTGGACDEPDDRRQLAIARAITPTQNRSPSPLAVRLTVEAAVWRRFLAATSTGIATIARVSEMP